VVSLGSLISGNALTIGVILAGVALFFGLGGAQGIGAKLGSGFKGFGDSFLGGLTGAFGSTDKGESTPDSPADPLKPNPNLSGEPTPIGFGLLFEGLQEQSNIFQNINNLFSNIFSGAQFNPSAFNPASSFSSQAITARIGRVPGGTNQPSNIGGTPFGGFSDANEQELALQNAILQSQIDNPSFFLK